MDFSRYQVIIWREWIGFKRLPPYPAKGEFAGEIYDLRLCLGFIEVRRFTRKEERKHDIKEKKDLNVSKLIEQDKPKNKKMSDEIWCNKQELH